MISLVSRFSPDIQQGFYALQRSVAINPIEQKLIDNLKSLQSDNLHPLSANKKSEKALAKEKPKTIQQPVKTTKNSDSTTLYVAKDKTKASASSAIADSSAARLRSADILKKAALAHPAQPQPSEQNTDATTTDTKTQTVNDHAKIDASAVADDPAATLKKADIIRKATPVPAQPSNQNIQDVTSTTAKAQLELLKKNQSTQNGNKDYLGSKIDLSA